MSGKDHPATVAEITNETMALRLLNKAGACLNLAAEEEQRHVMDCRTTLIAGWYQRAATFTAMARVHAMLAAIGDREVWPCGRAECDEYHCAGCGEHCSVMGHSGCVPEEGSTDAR